MRSPSLELRPSSCISILEGEPRPRTKHGEMKIADLGISKMMSPFQHQSSTCLFKAALQLAVSHRAASSSSATSELNRKVLIGPGLKLAAYAGAFIHS